jgi:hypothetical protein
MAFGGTMFIQSFIQPDQQIEKSIKWGQTDRHTNGRGHIIPLFFTANKLGSSSKKCQGGLARSSTAKVIDMNHDVRP